MKNNLKQILQRATDNTNTDLADSFKCMVDVLLMYKSVFVEVPQSIVVDMSVFSDIERQAQSPVGLMKDFVTQGGKSRSDDVKYFKEKGVLLYDGMCASAFGHMSYIYRAKGIRIYLFEDKTVEMFNLYSTMDHNGFQYVLEEVDIRYSIDEITNDVIHQYLGMFEFSEFKDFSQMSDNLKILYMLINIKQDYKRAYYLEYLLYPPDVDYLSQFSINIREMLWSICLSNSFKNQYGEEIQKGAMNALSKLDISPSVGQLNTYIENLPNNRDIKEVLKSLEDNMQKMHDDLSSQDIVEAELSFGIFKVNLNACLKCLHKKLNTLFK